MRELPQMGLLGPLGTLGDGGLMGGGGATSYEALKRRRAIAAALATRNRGFPKTLGEGLTYFGESVGEAIGDWRLSQMEKELKAREAGVDAGSPKPTRYDEDPPASTPPPATGARTSSMGGDGGVEFDVADMVGVDEAFAPPAPEVAMSSSRSLASQPPPEPNLPPPSEVNRDPRSMVQQASLSGGITPNTAPPPPPPMQQMPAAGGYVSPHKLPAQATRDIEAYVPEYMRPYASTMVYKESTGRPNLVSPTGAKGYTQFTRKTGKDYGMVGPGFDNRADPKTNLEGFVKFTEANDAKLRKLLGRDPTMPELAATHQQGFGGFSRLNRGELPPSRNLAVNNVRTRDPAAALAKVKGYYDFPDEPMSPREQVTRALAARQGTGDVLDQPRPVQTVAYNGPVGTADDTPSMAQQPPQTAALEQPPETPNEVPPVDPEAIVPRRVTSTQPPPSMVPPRQGYAAERTPTAVQTAGVSAPTPDVPPEAQEQRGRIAATLAGLPSRPGGGPPTAALGPSPLGVPNPQETVSPVAIPPEGAPAQPPPQVAPDTGPPMAQSAAGPNGVTDAPPGGIPPGWGTQIPQNPAGNQFGISKAPTITPPLKGPLPSDEPIPEQSTPKPIKPVDAGPRPKSIDGTKDPYESYWRTQMNRGDISDEKKREAAGRVADAEKARLTEDANRMRIWMDKVNNQQAMEREERAREQAEPLRILQEKVQRAQLEEAKWKAAGRPVEAAQAATNLAIAQRNLADAERKATVMAPMEERTTRAQMETAEQIARSGKSGAPATIQAEGQTLKWDDEKRDFVVVKPQRDADPNDPNPPPVVKMNEGQGKTYAHLSKSALALEQYNRIPNADQILAQGIKDELVGKVPFFGNKMMSDQYRVVRNAMSNFLKGHLRDTSGAVINADEFESHMNDLVARYGDDKQTLANKAEQRAAIVESMTHETGEGRKLHLWTVAQRQLKDQERQVALAEEMRGLPGGPPIAGNVYSKGRKQRLWTGTRWEALDD